MPTLPVYTGGACMYERDTPYHCATHSSQLVRVPIDAGATWVVLCRQALADASKAPWPGDPEPAPEAEDAEVVEAKRRCAEYRASLPPHVSTEATWQDFITHERYEPAPERPSVRFENTIPCPECRAGKHSNCDGTTWSPLLDRAVPCPCAEADHPEVKA